MSTAVEMLVNALGRSVPSIVNGKDQVAFPGVGMIEPRGDKFAPPITIRFEATSVSPHFAMPSRNAASATG